MPDLARKSSTLALFVLNIPILWNVMEGNELHKVFFFFFWSNWMIWSLFLSVCMCILHRDHFSEFFNSIFVCIKTGKTLPIDLRDWNIHDDYKDCWFYNLNVSIYVILLLNAVHQKGGKTTVLRYNSLQYSFISRILVWLIQNDHHRAHPQFT